MKKTLLIALVVSTTAHSSVVGISTHPLSNRARLLSAEMTGYMGKRNDMGAGARYTQKLGSQDLLDLSASGAQNSKSMNLGAAIDLEILSEDVYRPRVSFKPFLLHQKLDDIKTSVVGGAPTLRKGFSLRGQEVFPYLAIPAGIRVDNATDEFAYYASLTLGASMPFPGANMDKLLLSVEGNKNMGASSDYVGCLVSWIWK